MNPRPPEPHSGALPGCATSRLTAGLQTTVAGQQTHGGLLVLSLQDKQSGRPLGARNLLLVYSQPSHVSRRTAVVRLEETGPTVPFPINPKPKPRCASGPGASVRLALPQPLKASEDTRVSAPPQPRRRDASHTLHPARPAARRMPSRTAQTLRRCDAMVWCAAHPVHSHQA